jgi:hypothetical protein
MNTAEYTKLSRIKQHLADAMEALRLASNEYVNTPLPLGDPMDMLAKRDELFALHNKIERAIWKQDKLNA